ncbi:MULTISPECIES: carbohydrate ABC transporter permease [unclassified Paenibacillus]|uniref:carbohydrate ABC transporter permease n=1 Tax=unclassified Paenibacillus TaxID=185978 RepID=UPI001C0FE4F3|nr:MULTISPECIES: carbohydrate ABC transporter permease [unclassified Paenibacillus]MBU5444509.1 carbohydrate ABC transporter permease [Paenibacillus sp. MSJ-34]CAH0122320.1 Diacetylchitobiose uptake system permease protein NgcG [Paenibacillus sp. CECT 9249]
MKSTTGEKIFYACNYLLLTLIGLSCLLPIVHILALSFSDAHSVASGKVVFWPVSWTFESYASLLKGTNIVNAFKNNVVLTVVGTVSSMACTILAAYPLSRRDMYGRRAFTLAIVFTMLFSGGIIPNYLVIKSLGLLNSYGAIWLPGLVSVFNMLVLKTYFEGLPSEMEEAARIDGCSEWRLILQIVLPLSKPVIAALTLFYAVGFWNQFMNVLIYMDDTTRYNLTVMVQQMIQSQSILQDMNNMQPEDAAKLTPETIKSAGVIVMLVPMLVVYPFLQKYFVKGVMIGAIKG